MEGEAGEPGGTWRLRLPTTKGGAAAAAGGTGAAAPALLSTRVDGVLCVCLPPAGARAGDTLLFAVPPRAAPATGTPAAPLALLDHSGGAPASASAPAPAPAPAPAFVEVVGGAPHKNRSRSQRVPRPGEPAGLRGVGEQLGIRSGGVGDDAVPDEGSGGAGGGDSGGGSGGGGGGAAGGRGGVVVVELPSGVVAGERLLAQVRPLRSATTPRPPHRTPSRLVVDAQPRTCRALTCARAARGVRRCQMVDTLPSTCRPSCRRGGASRYVGGRSDAHMCWGSSFLFTSLPSLIDKR